jgi:hypothetical protein
VPPTIKAANSAGGNADEGVDAIPAGIDAGHLVGTELDGVHEAGGGNYQRVLQNQQIRRQIDIAAGAQEAEHSDGGVEIDAAGPGDAHRQGDGFSNSHKLPQLPFAVIFMWGRDVRLQRRGPISAGRE